MRYADDCNIYVETQRAGERVMESVKAFLDKELRLKVNPKKSKVNHASRMRTRTPAPTAGAKCPVV